MGCIKNKDETYLLSYYIKLRNGSILSREFEYLKKRRFYFLRYKKRQDKTLYYQPWNAEYIMVCY